MKDHQDALSSATQNQSTLTKVWVCVFYSHIMCTLTILLQQLHESILSDVSSLLQRAWERQHQELSSQLGKVCIPRIINSLTYLMQVHHMQVSEAIQRSADVHQSHSEQVQTSFEKLSSQAGAFGQSTGTAVGEATSTLDSLVSEVSSHRV